MKQKKQSAQKLFFELLPHFLLSAFLFVCVFLIGHFESYTISPQANPDLPAETDSAVSLSVTQTKAENIPFITDIRTVAEYKDGIGIFDGFGNLLEVCPLDVTQLPYADRQLLKDGMIFDSEGELRNFLESLDS